MQSLEGKIVIGENRELGVYKNGSINMLSSEEIERNVKLKSDIYDIKTRKCYTMTDDAHEGDHIFTKKQRDGILYCVPNFNRALCRNVTGDPIVEFVPGSIFYISLYSVDGKEYITNAVGHRRMMWTRFDDLMDKIFNSTQGNIYSRYVFTYNCGVYTLIDVSYYNSNVKIDFTELDENFYASIENMTVNTTFKHLPWEGVVYLANSMKLNTPKILYK